MQQLPAKFRTTLYCCINYPVITTTLVSVVIVLVLYSTAAQEALVLIEGDLWSQIWRIFGTHLVHINPLHAFYNILVLWLLVFLFKGLFTNRLLFNAILLSALFATLAPAYLANDYHFVGFSGVLHGVWAYAALRTLATDKTKGLVLLAALVLKLGYDFITAGQSVGWLGGAYVAYLCHVGGALGGAIAVPTLAKTSRQLLQRR